MKKRSLWCLLGCIPLLTCLSVLCHGLEPDKAVTQYIHESWQVKDGLPQNTVFAITQTSDGYLWIGTTDGLVRFDGVNFNTFNKQNTEAIRDNKIFALCTGPEGGLWVGTGGGGLVYVRSGGFTRYSSADGLSHDIIRTLYTDEDSALWIGTEKGLCRFKEKRFTTYTTEDGLSNNSVRSISRDKEGGLWIGTAGGGLDYLENGTFTLYTTEDGMPSGYARTMYLDDANRLWIGWVGGGISIRENKKFSAYTGSHHGPTGNIYVLYQDTNRGFWAGSATGISRFTPGPAGQPASLPLLDVTAIYEDLEGSLWIGTYDDGLHRLRDARFVCYTKDEGLSANDTLSVYQDSRGTLWVGTNNWLNRWQNQGIKSLPTVDPEIVPAVLSIGEDRDGKVWFGTMDFGLYYYKDGAFGAITKKDGLSHNWVRAICSAEDGGIWAGTHGGGLNHIKNGKVKAFTTAEGLSNNTVLSVTNGGPRTLWIGTNDGLNRMRDGVFTVYRKGDGLSDNTVWTVYLDKKGVLWIGTNSGLNRFENGGFTAYTTKQGLKNDSIYQILEDGNDNLWMLCGNGVLRVAKRDLNEFRRGDVKIVYNTLYGRADGMKSTQSNQGGTQPAAWKTTGGKLWFATAKGVAVIDPNHLELNTREPPVLIEELEADGIKINPHANPSLLNLAPGIERLEFHFTALSLLVPERVKFRYRLEGYERDWREGGTSRSAHYMNIPPGEYSFHVTACNNDGIWNRTGDSLRFHLRSHFYKTWWFYVLSGVILILFSFGMYRWRIGLLKKREEELETLVARRTSQLENATRMADAANKAKSRFLAQMSHEIRTPLNSIIGFSDLLMEAGLEHREADYAKTIYSSGEALLTIIDDILDLSKIEAGVISFQTENFSIRDIASEVNEFIQPKIRGGGVNISCHVSPEVPEIVRQDAGRFRQVLLNLMANAAKFTREGDIELHISVEEEETARLNILSTVRDTGIGIPTDKLETIFDVFQQADDSITRKYGGTGLGLPISKQIARQMGGDIRVESTPGKGSIFYFTAWVKKDAPEAAEKSDSPDGQTFTGDPGEAQASSIQVPSLNILLAEDNPINQKLARHIFRKTSHHLEVVEDGRQAVETFTASPGKYDLILMDIQMPEMDGLQATREIRTKGFNGIPIIAMTAQSMKGDRQKCLDAGMNDYITKPIRGELILRTIEKWV